MSHRQRYIRYGVALFLACTAVLVLQLIPYLEIRGAGRDVDPLSTFLIVEAVAWYSWAAMVPVLDGLARRSLPGQRLKRLGIHVAVMLPFAAVHGALVWTTAFFTDALVATEITFPQYVRRQIVIDGIVSVLIAAGFTIAETRRRQALAVETIRAQLAEARLEALRQQLNPHFLFNTLNHIVMQLRLRETEGGIHMLIVLSDLLRQVLADRAQLTPLRRELAIIEKYLEIERARFGDRLSVNVHLAAEAGDALVPSFLLQPLLENALTHGVDPITGRCHVEVDIRPLGPRLGISVRDEGPGVVGDVEGLGIGIANTRERLAHLYGTDWSLALAPVAPSGVDVRVEFPLRFS